MVGDGINDAPVLAQADLSIAVSASAPLAKQRADVYLLRPGLLGVAVFVATAQRTKIILNQPNRHPPGRPWLPWASLGSHWYGRLLTLGYG